MIGPSAAQTGAPIPRLSNGKPDFNGVWQRPYVPDMTKSSKDRFQKGEAIPFTPNWLRPAHKLKPDADISMPLLNGVEAAREIRKHDPNAKIIFLTMHLEKIYAVEAMIAGRSGYVLKNAVGEELIAAIREVMNGRIYVTRSLAEPVMKALCARRESSDRAGGRLSIKDRCNPL